MKIEITAFFFDPQAHETGEYEYGAIYSTLYRLAYGRVSTVGEAKEQAQALSLKWGHPCVQRNPAIHCYYDKRMAVCFVEPFVGKPVPLPSIVHDCRVAFGKLASWFTTEDYAPEKGVVHISATIRERGDADLGVVVRNEAGLLQAVTLSEAYAAHAREVSGEVQWHDASGMHALRTMVVQSLLDEGTRDFALEQMARSSRKN